MPGEDGSPDSPARQSPSPDGAGEGTKVSVRESDESMSPEPGLTATNESSVQILEHRRIGNETTNYGSLPSIATGDIVGVTIQSRHTRSSVESSMPDPTDVPLSSAPSIPKTRMCKRRPSGSFYSEDEVAFRSSNIFVGSNQELPKGTATPPPGQMTRKI